MSAPTTKELQQGLVPTAVTTVMSALVSWGVLQLVIIPLVSFFDKPVYPEMTEEFGWLGIPYLLICSAVYILAPAIVTLFPILLFAPSRWPALLRAPLLGLAGAIVGVLFVVICDLLTDVNGGKLFMLVAGVCGMIAGIFASFHRRRF